MPEVYRKFGRSVRNENGGVLRIEEAGEAVEEKETFSCRPVERLRTIDPIDETELDAAVSTIRSMVEPPVAIERLVVSEGVAEHELGDRRWSERIRRVHLSMTCRSERAILYLGDFDLRDVVAAADALARCGTERDVPPRVRLAPPVSAALLPSLIGVAPPNVRLWQTARGFDGKGEPIEEREITAASHPNWYRPSYRSRPVRAAFHVRAECEVNVIDEDLPRAIALLASPDRLLLRVLCVDSREVYPATVRVARIDAVGPALRWYPYAAGSFGSELML
jgi:hypothetical protein